MAYKLKYHHLVKKLDLARINEKDKSMIKKASEDRFATSPEIYGKPLQRTLKGYWKLRVGPYRVVFRLHGDVILILGIIHRKDVYQKVQKRKV